MPIIVSKANKALLVPQTPATTNVLKGRVLEVNSQPYIVAPHDIPTTLLLRHMGYQTPHPMTTWYDWNNPSPDEMPYRVQKLSCEGMTEYARFYNLNDKGTGKTAVTLWSWDFLNKASLCGRMLVVAPRSTLYLAWGAEVLKRLPGRSVSILYGEKRATKKERLEKLAVDADIYVINHDGLAVIEKELAERKDIDVLVLDELAVYRNLSNRMKKMRVFAQRFKIVWGLTGSPMPQEPTDIWGQASIVTPHTVPKRRTTCKAMLMTQMSQYIWRPKPDAVNQAYAMLQPSCRYALDEVVELPELINDMNTPGHTPLEAPLSAQQRDVYEKVRKDLLVQLKEGTIKAVNQGVALSKLLQVAGGWVYTKNPDFVRLDAAPRIGMLIDEINSSAHKVLVFIPYRHTIEGIQGIIERLQCPFESAVVHGEMKNDRDRVLNDFQNTDRYKVLLIQPSCVHHGVTLTAADTAIWYLPVLSFDVYDQANARFRRIGQKHKQHLRHFVSTPAERKSYRILQAKDSLQDKLLDLLEENTAEKDALRGRVE